MARLHDYTNDIYDIADRNRVDAKAATTKFLTNVDRKDNYYPGAETVDWEAANAESTNLKKSAFTFYKAIQAKGDEVIALRAEGKRDEAKALIVNSN